MSTAVADAKAKCSKLSNKEEIKLSNKRKNESLILLIVWSAYNDSERRMKLPNKYKNGEGGTNITANIITTTKGHKQKETVNTNKQLRRGKKNLIKKFQQPLHLHPQQRRSALN
jgi:hypothetical protein